MRLLIVEDEPDLLETLSGSLRKEGYAVDSADHGSDGLMKALDTDYDVIILDVMLPGIDGWEILSRLRTERKKTPVIMLTARDSIPDRVRGLDTGADDYLTKPCDLDELLARIRALIRRSEGQPSPLIDLGDVLIDTASQTVTKIGEPVTLTAREYAMVEFFALRRGKVVSRTTLYEHLFDEVDSSISNLLDVHVYNLRKKFGSDFIKTRRGLGYCME